MGSDTRLAWLCENKKWDKVLQRLKSHPAEATMKDDNGDSCLHYLAELKAPLNVVDAMIKANPVAAIQEDCYGHTPLMWATKREHAWKVVDLLLTSWPVDTDKKILLGADYEVPHPDKAKRKAGKKLLRRTEYENGQLLLHVMCRKGGEKGEAEGARKLKI